MEDIPPYMKRKPIQELPPRVFISYSHQDREFAARLADDLAGNGIVVWWDEWGIRVGDSLLSKIQEGIIASSYLAVVLSPESVSSTWVQEELNAALHRQLDEKRVVVLPILLRECDIPPFIAEKKYADFTEDYDSGLLELFKAIEPLPTSSHESVEDGEYHHDYAFEWGQFGEHYGARVGITTHSQRINYSISCQLTMVTNEVLSRRFREFENAGFEWAWRWMLLNIVETLADGVQTVLLIEGDTPARDHYEYSDEKHGAKLHLDISARRLGPDPGEDVLYEWASVLRYIAAQHREGILAVLGPEEAHEYERWRTENPMS